MGVEAPYGQESLWNSSFQYGVTSTSWRDDAEQSRHESLVFSPVVLDLQKFGHQSLFHGEFAFQYALGSGARDDYVTECRHNVDLESIKLSAFAGADLLDLGGYNPDADVVLGLGAGYLGYTEVKAKTAACKPDTKDRGISLADTRVFAGGRFRYESGLMPRTAFFLHADMNFLGGLDPVIPLLYRNKTGVTATGLNTNLRLGLELKF